jgi:hypothetical protein
VAADSGLADSAAGGELGGPVLVLPEVGLWVDALAQLGLAKRTGLVLWWGLGPAAETRGAGGRVLDWRRVTFRIRAEAFDERGKRADSEEALVEPLRNDGSEERGGFPTPLHLSLKAGRYHIHLEGYPLIPAQAAGLDSLPRGRAELDAVVPEMSGSSSGWRTSDILFFNSARKWEPGGSPQRSWYDWIVFPNASREFRADSASAYLGFEVLRSREVVPRCGPGACRVAILFLDAHGGVFQQELRPVPEAGSVSAYLIPFATDTLAAGPYTAEVQILEGPDLVASTSRQFRVTR